MKHIMNVSAYQKNPMVHRDRRLARSTSAWVRSFACEDMRILIVCRGPVRKEAIDTFREMGAARVGILLSEKDSIVYTYALAPELRFVPPRDVHHVPDYTGANREQRAERIQQIIQVCKDNGYEYVFAGYGFMAEDESLVGAIEAAGLRFIGPCAHTVRAAGRKDEAKRTALEQKVSVTPGVENLTARTLLGLYPSLESLQALVQEKDLKVPPEAFAGGEASLEAVAEVVLDASYRKGIDIISIDQIGKQLEKEMAALFKAHPGRRVRLKAIGGGGGKGQRILQAPKEPSDVEAAAAKAPEKFREILSEVKAGGVGDNKNVLLELNIERTRHHEIQLFGNGEWCTTLGGRDCSLQMHEQKLLEVSITQEGLREAMEEATNAGREVRARALQEELEVLSRMEAEAERFGLAVGLDSVSTFECIVEDDRHYFMEVNTRIQVEHRVSELCYLLRFANPNDPTDSFDVHSLVEAMALVARHKSRLPRPTRIRRYAAAVEARLNAQDAALDPHAGGIVEHWSDPIEGEIRDDQGISYKNPDTGQFIRYRLAGAYDSNIALLITVGEDREESYRQLREVIRRTKLVGIELSTNLEFHFGLVNFFLATHVHAKPTTRFVVPYLTQVGLLEEEARKLDLDHALTVIGAHHERVIMSQASDERASAAVAATQKILERKRTLLGRPLRLVLDEPHILSGYLSALRSSYSVSGGKVEWHDNPVRALKETYHILNMSFQSDLPAAQVIWDHDERLLETACQFYDQIDKKLGLARATWPEVKARLESPTPPEGMDAAMWSSVQSAHAGHQLGLELLNLVPVIAERAGFFDIRVEEDLTVTVPDRLYDPELQARMKKVLVPPPVASGDEVVAVTGGMFYSREAPDRPRLIEEGQHFEVGHPLYVIEVMKMFNKVAATFSGTVTEILVDLDGTIVKKGQPLFKVRPDEVVTKLDPEAEAAERRNHTARLMQQILA